MKYILRRLLIAIPVLLGITVINYMAYSLAPGDPVSAMIDPQRPVSPEMLEARKRELGLDKPLPMRYVIWLGEAVQGNLGYSTRTHTPVLDRIMERLPATLQLTATALLIAMAVGVPLGIFSAIKQYSKLDYVLTFLSFSGISIPSFFFALGAIWLFSLKLDWLPPFGMSDPQATNPLLDRLYHLVLPATIMGIEGTAGFLRYTRSAVLEVLGQDYVRTARAKGLRERAVIVRHGLRSALTSIVTIVGLSLPGLFGGAFIIETIFAWPGMGQLGITAINNRDYPVIMGISLIGSTLVLLSTLVADILYTVVDPRVRIGA